MSTVPELHPGNCVRAPDGRIRRVRARVGELYPGSVAADDQQYAPVPGIPGQRTRTGGLSQRVSPEGYLRYLRVTLGKMHERQAGSHPST